jgi:hypothetical protein
MYARLNVLYKTFIGICQLLLYWILAYGRGLEAKRLMPSDPPPSFPSSLRGNPVFVCQVYGIPLLVLQD